MQDVLFPLADLAPRFSGSLGEYPMPWILIAVGAVLLVSIASAGVIYLRKKKQ